MAEILTSDDVAGVRKPLTQAHWLPAHAYTNPAIWPQELQRVLHREWLVVCRYDQVASPGEFICKEIAGTRVLVVRGTDGVIRAFHNVCRHRGMWVAQGRGQTRNFICPYHSWTYDLEGNLSAAPEMSRTADFDYAEFGLSPIRCEQWLGFVAINLDGKAAPFGTDLDDLAQMIAPWHLSEMVTANERVYETTWDWKLMWENAIEGYHTSYLHRTSAGDSIPTSLTWISEDLDGRAWSDLHCPFAGGVPRAMPNEPPTIENLPAFANEELVFFHVWPCLGFYVSPNLVTAYICEPVAPGRHRYVMQFYAEARARNGEGYEQWREFIAERFDVIQCEDALACHGVQAGMESGAWSPARYSDKERACWHFHRWYADRMVGIADQHPNRTDL